MTFLKPEQRQTLLWLGVAVALCVLFYSLLPVLTPFLLAVIIGYILNPGVDWLARHHVPRWLACLFMIVLFLTLTTTLVLTIVPVLQQELVALQKKFPELLDRLNATVAPHLAQTFDIHIHFSSYSLRKLISDQWGNQDLLSAVLSSLKIGGLALFNVAITLLLVPMVLFYLLLDWHSLLRRAEDMIPRRWLTPTTAFVKESDQLLAQFLRGQLSVMAILAIYYSIALAVAGFDVALPVGIFTGLLVFVPYVGFTTGLLLALLAALLQFGDLYGFLAVVIIYGVGQVCELFFLTPRLVGGRLGMSPLAVIFALLAFGELFGFFGILLALPASAVIMVALRHVRQLYLTSNLYRLP
jgi:predicted PurR-regulated permease PerM